jgi:hypothetical protein
MTNETIHHGLTFIVTVFILTFLFSGSVQADEEGFPFCPGEKLTFQINWSFIPAGLAVLQVLPIEKLNGIESYHFVMTAKTSPFVDHFYKVRDRIDAYADTAMTHSLLYKKVKQGKRKKSVIVSFNWDKQTAQYSNFGKKRKPISILPASFDPMSIFYAFRYNDLEENMEITNPVTDGKKCIIGKAKIIKREKIEVAAGTYNTYLVEPELEHIGGVFEKSKNAKLQVWVTADRRRVPVKIKSKVVIGSFIAQLVSAEGISSPD